jgi:hypothetical protein
MNKKEQKCLFFGLTLAETMLKLLQPFAAEDFNN